MPLTALHRHLIRRIFSRLVAKPDNSTALFYRRLFELDPDLKSRCNIELFERRLGLMQMLALAVKFIDQPAELKEWVEDTRRSGPCEPGEQQCQQIEAALLWLVEKQFGDDFTNQMRLAWIQFCEWLAHLLLANPDLDESRM